LLFSPFLTTFGAKKCTGDFSRKEKLRFYDVLTLIAGF
jgi:hypothetical protein